MEQKKNTPLFIQIIIPLLIAVFCGGVILLLGIKPYEKIKTYLHVGFMDNSAVIPQSSGIAGLNIIHNDIDTEYSGDVSSTGDIIYPEYGTQYAVLECDALDMFVPVYFGNGSELLENGGCSTPSSAVAGDTGNTVISAHVNTYFSNLSDIKENDEVVIYTEYGRFTYKVTELIEFSSKDKKYIRQQGDDRLTLYTCEMNLLSESDKRIGAVCRLEKREFYTAQKEAE